MQIIPVFLSLVFAYGAICTQLPMNQPTQDFDNGHALPLLSDLLIIQSHSTIFRDYLRSVRSIDSLLRDTTKAMTVLVPSNKAVLSMKRKPHQSPTGDETKDGEIDVTEEQLEFKRSENVRRWVSAHVIPEHPITFEESKNYPTVLEGASVGFSPINNTLSMNWKDWRVVPGITIADKIEGLNGVLYLIEGTVQL